MAKKLLALLLAVALAAVGLVSCKGKSKNGADDNKDYTQNDVILNYELVESRDAAGNLQKDEKGQQIYDRYTFDDIDSNSVIITAFEPLVVGSNLDVDGKNVVSYIRCYAPHTVAIPEKLGGKTVTAIGVGVFRNLTDLNAVVIPAGVDTIGAYAFAGCTIAGVTIPAAVKTLGEGAFHGCSKLATLTFETTALETIPQSAFMGCAALTEITIPAGVKTVALGAFFGCTAVTSLTVADGVETIGELAFYKLTNLASVTLPDSLTTVGELAFYGCDPATKNTVAASYFADPSAFAPAE